MWFHYILWMKQCERIWRIRLNLVKLNGLRKTLRYLNEIRILIEELIERKD